MTSVKKGPKRWANDINIVLESAFGADRFPLNVSNLALEYSRTICPEDPITMVHGDKLPGFEGGLFRAPSGSTGWGIIYNNAISSEGRINFTLAHEFGHYLLHRTDFPDGRQCRQEDMARWDSTEYQIESEANDFAATLLMPFDDFRKNIAADACPTLDDLGNMAQRYGASLMAATLRWLQYTEHRSVLVVSRDDFILWSNSSSSALKSGAFYRTRDKGPIAVPERSLVAKGSDVAGSSAIMVHDRTVWFDGPCSEEVLFSEQYDFAISLVHLENDDTGTLDAVPESD